jgi:hypothetical protein
VRYAAALKPVGRDKLKRRISDLPDWASPPKEALKTAIMAATGATDIEWDPMEENGSIALDFEYEQPWMARKNVKIYLGYKQRSTLPSTTNDTTNDTTHTTNDTTRHTTNDTND